MTEQEYLLADDYGTAGVSAVIRTPSKSDVEAAYPDLIIFDERPGWVDDAQYERIKARSGFRFNQPSGYWTRFYRSRPPASG